MSIFEQKLTSQKMIIGDGAMGTSLQKEGLAPGEAPEKWNITHPEKIIEVHASFLNAGSELIETNTFGASYVRLQQEGLESDFTALNQRAVQLAQKAAEAAGGDIIVAGSVGPTGKMLQPLGDLKPREAFSSYRRQISILAEEGVDVIIIETITALEEMEQALAAASEVDIPVIAQMNFQENKKTVMGIGVPEFVDLADEYGVEVIGTNCTPGAEITVSIIKEMKKNTDRPLSAFPNAGKPELREGTVYYPEQPEDFANYVPEFEKSGVRILGGCCGTTPETIKAVKKKSQ